MGARTIAILSGKGGVGKTTLAVNICASLRKNFSKNPILIDANLNRADASMHLGFINYSLSLSEVMSGKCKLEDSTYTVPNGIRFIPSSLKNQYISGKMSNIKAGKLEADFVIIDSAPGIGREAIFAMKSADDIIIATTPDAPAVNDAISVVNLARKMKKNVIGIALNKVAGNPYELTAKEVELMCGVPVIQTIRDSERVNESIAEMKPIVLSRPKDGISSDIGSLAAKISGEKFEKPRGIFRRLFRA